MNANEIKLFRDLAEAYRILREAYYHDMGGREKPATTDLQRRVKEALDRYDIRSTAMRTALHPRDATENRALITTLRGVLVDVRAHNGNLNDPRGDGSGVDAESPTGDDYNFLLGLLAPLYPLIGEEAP